MHNGPPLTRNIIRPPRLVLQHRTDLRSTAQERSSVIHVHDPVMVLLEIELCRGKPTSDCPYTINRIVQATELSDDAFDDAFDKIDVGGISYCKCDVGVWVDCCDLIAG